MAQVRSLAKTYASISRPKTVGGQTSYFSTLAKRTQAAEDDVVDHNYQIGILSAENYMTELTKRLSRPYNSPLQTVNLQQKIEKTREDYTDSIYQNQYKAGQISDKDMYDYENAKLLKMSAADGQAYQTQSAKVAGLLDKANKAERKQYRITEMNRISRLPEDNSNILEQKAAAYAKLRDMAIEDGDQNDATTLDTAFNNYSSSAKQAKINDELTASMQATKEQYHPSTPVDAGVQSTNIPAPYSQPAGVMSGVSGGNPVTSGNGAEATASSSSPAGSVADRDAMDAALAQAQQEGERKLSDAAEKVKNAQEAVQSFSDSIKESEAYKESIQVALKSARQMGMVDKVADYEERIRSYDRQIIDYKDKLKYATQVLSESEKNYQEVGKTVNYTLGFVKNQSAENQILDAEQNLEIGMQQGLITKEDYLQKRRAIIQQKVNLYGDQAQLYSEYDKTNPAADAARKAQKEEQNNYRKAINDVNNAGRYELVDGGDGVVKLQDVYKLKSVSKSFEQDYLKDGNVWRKVMIPDVLDANGDPLGLSTAIKQGYSAQEGTAFVVKMVDGVMTQVPVTVYNNKPVITSEIQQGVDAKKIVFDPNKKTWVDAPKTLGEQATEALGKAGPIVGKAVRSIAPPLSLLDKAQSIPKIDLKAMYESASKPFDSLLKKSPIQAGVDLAKSKGVDLSKSPISQIAPGLGNLVGNALGKAKDFGGNLLEKLIQAIPRTKVYGQEVTKNIPTDLVGKPFAREIASIWGDRTGEVYRVLQGENGAINPNAVNINKDGSADTGLLQVNENTFNDFMRRKGNILRSYGITSYADMRNPLKNLQMAKIIHDEQGWNAWYGAPEDLRSPTGTPSPTATPTPMSTPTPKSMDLLDKKKQLDATNGWNTPKPTSTQSSSQPKMTTVSAKSSNSMGAPITKVVNNVPSVKQYIPDKGFVYQPIKAPTPPAPAKPNIIQQVQSVASKAVNTAKNVLGKLKFW